MNRIYYIDTENVGEHWIDLLYDKNAKFKVFYTENTPRMSYESIVRLYDGDNNVEFIKCYLGKNGLDFQLCSCLGYELGIDKTSEVVIVSNDKGYEAVINFWKDQDVCIYRIKAEECKEEKRKQPQMIPGVGNETVETLMNCFSNMNKTKYQDIYTSLIKLYKMDIGLNIYNYYKVHKSEYNGCTWSREEKISKLLDVIVKKNKIKNITDNLYEIICSEQFTSDEEMFKRLEQAFPTKKGKAIIKALQPYYKLFININ